MNQNLNNIPLVVLSIKQQLKYREEDQTPPESKNWVKRYGILISLNEAKELLNLIEKKNE